MKKTLSVIGCTLLALTILCSACQADDDPGSNLYVFDVSKFGKIRYQYFVLSNSGNVLDDGYLDNQEPTGELIGNSCLMLKIPAGNAAYYQFFDLDHEIMSSVYQQVIHAVKGYVLYTDLIDGNWKLIVSSIFDSQYYQEYPIDLASIEGRVNLASYNSDTGECNVTYISKQNYQEQSITVFFPL